MASITGRFYFKITDAGNLVGEYSNDATLRSLPESAWRKRAPASPTFVGDYVSSWYEPTGKKSIAADLVISSKPQSTGLFSLKWTGVGSNENYEGEAMLCDGILVGNYRSV